MSGCASPGGRGRTCHVAAARRGESARGHAVRARAAAHVAVLLLWLRGRRRRRDFDSHGLHVLEGVGDLQPRHARRGQSRETRHDLHDHAAGVGRQAAAAGLRVPDELADAAEGGVVKPGRAVGADLPDLAQHALRQAGLHHEAHGLAASDAAVLIRVRDPEPLRVEVVEGHLYDHDRHGYARLFRILHTGQQFPEDNRRAPLANSAGTARCQSKRWVVLLPRSYRPSQALQTAISTRALANRWRFSSHRLSSVHSSSLRCLTQAKDAYGSCTHSHPWHCSTACGKCEALQSEPSFRKSPGVKDRFRCENGMRGPVCRQCLVAGQRNRADPNLTGQQHLAACFSVMVHGT
jgi:hypothetical protein